MGRDNKKRRAEKKRARIKRAKDRLNQRKLRNKKNNHSDIFIQQLSNPFDGLNDNERKDIIQEIKENNEIKYRVSLFKINELVRRYNPISLLAILTTYGLTIGVSDQGVTHQDGDSSITQAHVELLQALALQVNPNVFKNEVFAPNIVQELWDAIIDFFQALNFHDFSSDSNRNTVEENAIISLQRRMRGNTQMVRNWGFFSQTTTISKEIYGCFDVQLRKTYGFTASNAIVFFQKLIKKTEKANTERHHLFSRLYKIKSKSKMILKYHEMIGASRDEALSCINGLDLEKESNKSLYAMLLSHSDLLLHEDYLFSPAELSAEFEINEDEVVAILEKFSLELGGLENYKIDFLPLANPVWLAPIVKINQRKYFCAIPQAFFSFVIPIFDDLIEKINKPALSDRRSDYLENKIAEIIHRRFPESKTVTGVKWKLDNVEYETDLITFIDSYAIIVEAKSGSISDPALRGAPKRLKRHIEEILIAPNLQSKRLELKINRLKQVSEPKDQLLKTLPVDIDDIRTIIRVSVSLENFASIQANIEQLKKTGWLPDDFQPCPTMSLADFDTLFDFLEHPIQIIHYLKRRQDIEESVGYMGDELDLMGLYLSTLFNISNIEKNINFVITPMSSPLDAYYNSKDAGIVIPKPKPKISALFQGILEQLEIRKIPRWTEIGTVLCMFSPEDQRKLTKMIKVIEKNVQKKWHIEGHRNTVMIIPNKSSQYALCYIVYNNKNLSRKHEFINNGAAIGLEADHVTQCLVIARNMDEQNLKYHFIGLLEEDVERDADKAYVETHNKSVNLTA